MLSRRHGLGLAGALVANGGLARAAAPTVKTPVNFAVPPGAADCHVHVIADPVRFPMFNGRGYTPPTAPAEELLDLQHALHMDHVVIVTPSIYGTDNAAMIDGIRQLGPKRARGVAVIGPETTAAEMDFLAKIGVHGIRVNLESGGVTDPQISARNLDAAVAQIGDRKWHIQIYARLPVIAALKDRLAALPMPVVFDHFAGATAAKGVGQPGFDTVLALVHAGKAYVKISGAYRVSKEPPDYPDAAPLAKALIAANPSRILWGSDWPHTGGAGPKPGDITPPIPVDDGRVLNLLTEWASDSTTRRRILVDNPARLYGF
jgi:predicted TIM-barrel fold metal-dependent hydrolase